MPALAAPDARPKAARDRPQTGERRWQTAPGAGSPWKGGPAQPPTREEHEDARQVARDLAKTAEYQIAMKLRKKVEMLFAHLKRILGLGRLR